MKKFSDLYENVINEGSGIVREVETVLGALNYDLQFVGVCKGVPLLAAIEFDNAGGVYIIDGNVTLKSIQKLYKKHGVKSFKELEESDIELNNDELIATLIENPSIGYVDMP